MYQSELFKKYIKRLNEEGFIVKRVEEERLGYIYRPNLFTRHG